MLPFVEAVDLFFWVLFLLANKDGEVDDQSACPLVFFERNELSWVCIGDLESALTLCKCIKCENLGSKVVSYRVNKTAAYINNVVAIVTVQNPAVRRGGT